MDRSVLILKRREIVAQIEGLQRKLASIDDVLSLFPDEDDSRPKEYGKYVQMGPTEAILDACGVLAPVPLTVANLTDILIKEGMPTKSANLRITVAGIADRLVNQGRLFRGKKNGQKAYFLPVTQAA